MSLLAVIQLLFLISSVHCVDDDRLTINRLGYGVFFERIGEVTDSGGMIYNPVTWSIIQPEFTTPQVPLLNCSVTTYDDLDLLCTTVNSLISSVNGDVYTQVNQAKKKLADTLKIIPLSNTSVLISETEDENHTARKRKKRETYPGLDSVLNSPDTELPEWITGGTDKSSNLEYLIPGRLAGELFTNIFNMPSSSTIKNTEGNLRALGGAIYTNTQSINNLGTQLQYVIQLADARMDQLENMGTIIVQKMATLNDYMVDFQREFYAGISEIGDSIVRMDEFKSIIVSDLYPELHRAKQTANLIDDLVDRWTFGIINLTSGYISQYLVSEEMIKNALDYIKSTTLTLPTFSAYRLMSQDPAFYYKLNKISYARAENKLLLTMEVPLFIPTKKMTLYRISDFPMPVTAGLEGDDIEGKHGYTSILDLPSFIAVSENLESYIELTDSQYLACDGEVKGIQNCGNNVGVPRLTTAEHKSCAYSIFSDTPQDVKRYCQTAFTKDIPQGSARQLSSDSSFLIQGGGDTKYWTMTCPSSSAQPHTKIEPCSLCRIKVDCGCSLFGTNFRIPTHISGCEEFISGVPSTTKIYQRNIATLREFVSDLDLQQVSSFETSINQMWPSIDLPVIEYTVPDQLDNYIELSNEQGVDFARGAELIKQNLTIYKDRVDEALVTARNFTDQEVNRAGTILGALEELFNGVFGGEIWQVLSAVFSPLGISLLGFIIGLFLFVPALLWDIQEYREKKQERDYERELLMEIGKVNVNSLKINYGFWPKTTTMLPARVKEVDGVYFAV
uniref:Membrane-fusion protein n=1 Tax=Malaco herpesvirus 1 TaxID=3031797 RepID=A0AA48P924_9VIRU|nr:TPA_asm: membrane-fusion protein [Malaco herpesvirus 1]